MSALCRSLVLGRTANAKLLCRPCLIASRPVTIVAQKAPEKSHEDHDLRNMKLGRPQSPHLTIYEVQLTSMLSISHRMTGIALSSYMMALGIGAVALPNDIGHYVSMIEGMQLSAATLFAAKFVLGFPLAYHWCNGIRHLLWDTGRYLTNADVYRTGYAMLALTAVLTGFLAAL